MKRETKQFHRELSIKIRAFETTNYVYGAGVQLVEDESGAGN